MTAPIRKLRASAKYPDWTEDEDHELREFYARAYAGDPTPQSVLAASLGRALGGVRSRADKLGITQKRMIKGGFVTSPVWSDAETEILRANYARMPTCDLAKLLPGRPVRAIYVRAFSLGFWSGRNGPWTDDQVRALGIAYRRGVSIVDVAIAIGRAATTVSKYASNHGYDFGRRARTKVPPTLNGILALADPAAADLEKASRRAKPPCKTPKIERARRVIERERMSQRRKNRKLEAKEQRRCDLLEAKAAERAVAQRARQDELDRVRQLRAAALQRDRERRAAERAQAIKPRWSTQALQPARSRRSPESADRAAAARANAVRRRIMVQAAAFVDSGQPLRRTTSINIKVAQRAVIAQREDAARRADPIEQAKLQLQRRGRIVYSMAVHGGPKDRFFVSGMGKDVTAEQLLAAAEKVAA